MLLLKILIATLIIIRLKYSLYLLNLDYYILSNLYIHLIYTLFRLISILLVKEVLS